MSLVESARLSSFIPSFLINNPIYQDRGARTFLFALGAGYFLTKALSYTASLLAPLFYLDRDLGQRYGKNSWVFITGASDGIGRAFALEFARRGFNIILLGRNKEKLEEVDQEVRAQHPTVQTRVLVFDLKYAYKVGFVEEMFHDVKDLDISIVVNNAGQMTVGPYYKADINEVRELIIVNCLAAALVVRVLFPKLMLRKHRSAVISMSSKVATFPRPFQQIYGCTKIFNEYLSRGLKYEYSRIDFLALKPGKVQTNMTDNRRPDMKTITPKEFVNVGLRYLGRVDKTYGHWKHRWHSWVTDVIPERWRIYWFQRKYPELKSKIIES